MKSLPQPLLPLSNYAQFINYRLIPVENGKTKKVPVSITTSENINPLDPAQWMTVQQAIHLAQQAGGIEAGFGVGFVFTRNDPFFFLDIDHCLVDGQWTQLVYTILAKLPGVACEISQSRTGLHLIGTGICPEHGCKNTKLGLELYTEDRFVALTGDGAVGNVMVDCSAALPEIVATWFPPRPVDENARAVTAWSNAPVPGWSGPEDDDELIAMMMKSGGLRVALGMSPSFENLWTANADVLGQFYPDPEQGRAFDASNADSALAQHLAFWTGKNCQRIYDLMYKSSLRRDKWDRRERGEWDRRYLPRTILRAVASQRDVYKGSPPSSAPEQPVEVTVANLKPEMTVGHQMMTAQEQVEYFADCVYVRDANCIWVPDGSMLTQAQFKSMYGGYKFFMDGNNEKTTRNAWEAFTESQAVRFPKVISTCFRPELKPGQIIEEEGLRMVNTYVPISIPSEYGDVTPFLAHLHKLLPNDRDREIVLCYMAAVVQYPGVKFQWCPLIQGTEGNGKTLLARTLMYAVGNRYSHVPNAAQLGNNGLKFNGWMEHKLFIAIEDIYVSDRREITEELKPFITNERTEFQSKGSDQHVGDNRANWLMFSNHKDAIHVTVDGRRYCMIYSAQQSKVDKIRDGMVGRYFPDLYAWLRNGGYRYILHYLKNYKINDEFNPAGICQEAPHTSSTEEALMWSMGTVEQQIMDCVDEGVAGFAKGWISSKAVDRLIENMRMSSKIHINRRRSILESLGYDYHPALPKGRASTEIIQEGGRPKLYTRRGSLLNNITDARVATDQYMRDQGYINAISPTGAMTNGPTNAIS